MSETRYVIGALLNLAVMAYGAYLAAQHRAYGILLILAGLIGLTTCSKMIRAIRLQKLFNRDKEES